MESLKKRTLQLESLENRVLLSATPSFAPLPPTGTQAVYWTQEIDLKSYESTQISLDTTELDSVTVFCINHNQVNTIFRSPNGDASFNVNRQFTVNTSDYTTATLVLENSSNKDGSYTLYAVSNSALETELLGEKTNNTFSESVQPLTFTTLRDSSGNQSAKPQRQVVVMGEIGGADTADCYRITAQGGTANFQLHSLSGTQLSLELYDANQNILAYSTSVDDVNSVLSSVALKNGNYFLRVTTSNTNGSSTTAASQYALTVTENCIVETSTGEESALVNHLNTSGVGLGMISGSESAMTEKICEFTGEKIRAFSVSDSRMATVTYLPKTGGGFTSVTLRLLEYSASMWRELASVTYDTTNTTGTGIDLATFGQKISVSGNSILIGDAANNLAQVYTRNGDKLLATTLNAPSVATGDKFGATVLLQGNYAFISAPNSDLNGTDSGAVYVFQRSVTSWNFVRTLAISDTTGFGFGSVLAWDSISSRLCVACENESANMLYIFHISASGEVTLESTLNGAISSDKFETQESVTHFGRAVALSGNTLAVSCGAGVTNVVRIYAWNTDRNAWEAVTELQALEESKYVTNFGGSISLSGSQLAVGSNRALNSNLAPLGIVYLYHASASGVNAVWELDQTIQHTEEGALGNAVALSANRLDVWDSLQNRIYTFTNFSNIDRWTLNVTGMEPVTFTLSAQKEGKTLPNVEILDPNGLPVTFTSKTNTDSTTRTYTFTPKMLGTYTLILSAGESGDSNNSGDTSGTEYRLEVTSGTLTEYQDAGISLNMDGTLSNEIIVEYAQQILVSSLTDMVAQLGNVTLQNPELLDGNKIVWTIPQNITNGTYALTISGLESVSGMEIPALTTEYKYVNPIPTVECTLGTNNVVLEFSEPVNPSTVNISAITVKNNVTGAILSPKSYTIQNDGQRVEFIFTETLGIGDWTITLAENALSTVSGQEFVFGTPENPTNSIRIDTLAPDVVSISVDAQNGLATMIFTEPIEGAEFWLTGAGYGNISFTEMVNNGNTLTVKWAPMSDSMSLLPDQYTFRVTALMDAAGNYTYAEDLSESAVYTFSVTASTNQTMTVSNSAWERAVMDGAFAYRTDVVGYVTQNAPMSFKIPHGKGEIFTYFVMENGSSGNVENTGKIQTVWNAETETLTVSAPTLTAEEGVTFRITLLRNTTLESGTVTETEINSGNAENGAGTETGAGKVTGSVTELSLATLATQESTVIRQGSVSGTLMAAGETDTYRFTISGKSSFSAAFTSQISGQATLNLYEVLEDGSTVWLASSDSAMDTLDAWFQNIQNTDSSDVTYLLQVSATGVGTKTATGAYNLVITENALFNGITNGTRDNALLLDTQNTVVGHVSQESGVIQAETIYEEFLGHSIVATENYLFVGIPGNSTNGEDAGSVSIYKFDGLKYRKIADLTASDTVAGDAFGTSMVFDGQTLLVSAPNHSNVGPNGVNQSSGAVYAFRWNGDGTFTQTHQITNPNTSSLSDFGYVMDYSDGLLAVGTQDNGGSVWAFHLNLSNGQYQSYRLSEAAMSQTAFYGFSVAVDNGNILVAVPGTQTYTTQEGGSITVQGSVLLYQWNGARYESVQQFIPTESDSALGYSVAMENGLAVIAAYNSKCVILYTADLTEFNPQSGTAPTIMRTELTGITSNGTADRTVRLQDGILSLAGFTQENTALLLKLNGNTWEILQTSTLPPTQTEIANGFYGFDSAQGNHMHFVTAPSALTNGLPLGKVYTFDYQDDYYRFTADSDTITVTLQTAAMYTGLNVTGTENITLLVELTDVNGNHITGTATNNQYTFQVTAGTEYYLSLATADGTALDYVLTVDGIVQNLPTLEMESLILRGENGNELSVTEKLTERPTSLTFNFSDKIRADRLSVESVQIFNGKENVSATHFTLSNDGKSVTFHFSPTTIYFTTASQLMINTNDFCTLAGGVLTLDGQAEDGIAPIALSMNGVTVTNRLRASEESVSLTWKFSENVLAPVGGWENAVSVTRTRGGNAENITAHGTFSYVDGVLTWTANNVSEILTDDVLRTTLNAEKVVPESGIPLLGLTQSGDSAFLYVKTFTVNLNGATETRLGVRTESSLSLVDSTTATVETLPENADWVHEWNTIWVEVWGRVVSTTENGLTTYTAQISYNPTLFTPFDTQGNVTYEWNREVFQNVAITDAGNNTITITATVKEGKENVGVSTGETDAGYALITSIQFLPKYGRGNGTPIQFAEDGVTHKPTESGICFVENSISIQDTNGQSLDGNTEDLTGTLPGVYAVVYDLNDDGVVNINDLVRFAQEYGKVSTISTDAAACDYNANRSVDIHDLVFFAQNYQQTGDKITFSTSLTQHWGVVEIMEPVPVNSVTTLDTISLAPLSATTDVHEMESNNTKSDNTETVNTENNESENEVTENIQGETVETLLFQNVGNVTVTDWTVLMPYAMQEAQNRERQEIELRARLLEETLDNADMPVSSMNMENIPGTTSETVSQIKAETSQETAMWEFLLEKDSTTDADSEYEWDFSVNNMEKNKI
ncbi:MAG: LEPR-XLL domain-containing protein [Planctomycetia bacterium]|nr:LEPR-XLL domain-containing protein [Planctomycetia bacterium]